MPFRTFADIAEATTYADSLDERWPDRPAVRTHISRYLRATPGTRVVEFCSGAGALAQQLFIDHPNIEYTGIDITAPLMEIAHTRLADHASQITWLEADLNQDAWLDQITPPIDAFMSLQSLHDLGDETAVARIFQLAARNLAPQGQLIYADLLASTDPATTPNPGKLSVARHLELLRDAGFANVACTWQTGDLGCFLAQVA